MIIPGLAVAFVWLHCILVTQAAIVTHNKVALDSVVISGSGTLATVAGALVVTGVTTATGLQINGTATITGSLTASTYPVMPARSIQKQAITTRMSAKGIYSNIAGLTHTFTALADRRYDIQCDTEAVATTNTSYSRIEVSVWDGTTMLSSEGQSFVNAGLSPSEQFVSLGSTWTGTLTAGSHTITCKYYLPGSCTSITGGSPFYHSSRSYTNVWDGNVLTFYDYHTGSGGWTQCNFGSLRSFSLIEYYPRRNYLSRMNGGEFKGIDSSNNEFSIFSVSATPALAWNNKSVSVSAIGIKYVSPAGSHGNVAEIRVSVPADDDLEDDLEMTDSSTLRIVETVNGGTLL